MTMPDNANDADQQHDSPPDDQAGHPAPGSTDDERPPASEVSDEGTPDDNGGNVTGEARK